MTLCLPLPRVSRIMCMPTKESSINDVTEGVKSLLKIALIVKKRDSGGGGEGWGGNVKKVSKIVQRRLYLSLYNCLTILQTLRGQKILQI